MSHQRAVFPCSAKSLVGERPKSQFATYPSQKGTRSNTAKCPTSGPPRFCDHVFQVQGPGYCPPSIIARMSRFSKTKLRRSPVSWMATSTIARAKSSARITSLGNSTRNTG